MKMERINLEDLTIGQLRQAAAILNLLPPAQASVEKPLVPDGSERPVLVTTAHRGVFFGYAKTTNGDTIKLRAARNCVYWSTEVKGFVGLAANGPTSNCRIGPKCDLELRNITCVVECTPEAVKAWEAAPWKS